MLSFLANCPDCGVLIAKDSACSNCGSYALLGDQVDVAAIGVEYARRYRRHQRNYLIYMGLTIAAGFMTLGGVATILRVLLGRPSAMIMISALAALAMFAGFASFFAARWFPIALMCPSCDTRIDEVGLDNGFCPACKIVLKPKRK